MLAQLKTVVLIKEAIKLAFFRLVSGASAFVGSITVYYFSKKLRLFHLRNCQETEDLVQRCVLLPSQNRANWLYPYYKEEWDAPVHN